MFGKSRSQHKRRIIAYTAPDETAEALEGIVDAFVKQFKNIGLGASVARGLVISNGTTALKGVVGDPAKMEKVLIEFTKSIDEDESDS